MHRAAGDAEEVTPRPRYWTPTENRVPLIAGGALVLVMIVLGVVCSGGKKEKKGSADQGARSVVLAGDRARTLVIPPCGTGVKITAANAPEQIDTPGSTAVQLPPTAGTRAVVVARCSASGGSQSESGSPSVAYVLAPGETKGFGVAAPTAKSKLIVPSGSRAETVVVTACTKAAKDESTAVLAPSTTRSTTAFAPAC